MRSLLSDQFAPITSSIGFLQLPLDLSADSLITWRRSLDEFDVVAEQLKGSLPQLLPRLQPLTGGVEPRELLIETAGEWTAYFSCGIQGGDPLSVMSHLSRTLRRHAVAIRCIPHTRGTPFETPGRYGAVQFELLGPLQTEFLNYVRSVSVVNDGGRWRFDANGVEQDFEEVEAYSARRVRERFTSDMLARYCEALGIRPFDSGFYLERGVFIQRDLVVPRGGSLMTLREAQLSLGIVPGAIDRVRG